MVDSNQKLIDLLNEVDFITIDSLNKASLMNLLSNYYNEEYEVFILDVIGYVKKNQFIDILTLLLYLNSLIILNIGNIETVLSILDSHINFIKNSYQKISPISPEKEKLLSKGIDIILNTISDNLNNLIKDLNHEQYLMIEEIEKLILKLLNIVDNKQLNYDEELSNNIFLRLNHALTFLEKSKAKRNENINNDKNYIKNREKNIISEKKYSSQKWEELINKIDILKQLINEDRIFETSIVYDDIQQMLAKFDPKQYFPEIFFPLYATLSPHIKDIHKNIDKFSNTIQWYMSKKMYNIDYFSFLKERTCINENNIINSPQEIIDNYFYPKTSSVANELEYNDDKKIAGCIDDLIDNTEISDEFTKK